MAKIVRARRPYRWLRHLLLAAGLVVVGAIGLMLAAYRFGRAERPEAESRRAVSTGDRVFVGQDFDYTQTSEGTPVFRIRAERSRQDRDDTAYLEGVVLDVFHEDGDTYTVTSDRATFNEHSWRAELEGHVVLRGWGRLELETRALELRQQGQILASSGAVALSYPPDLVGRASSLLVDRRTDTVALGGGVHVRSVPGAAEELRLDCERVVYQLGPSGGPRPQGSGGRERPGRERPGRERPGRERPGRERPGRERPDVIRAVGGVDLHRGRDSIAAETLTLFLEDEMRTLDSLRARWDVAATLTSVTEEGAVARVVIRGQSLEIKADPAADGLQHVELDGEDQEATLKVTDGTGLARQLSGRFLTAQAKDNQLVHVEGVGDPLVLRAGLDLDDELYLLRQACAEQGTARFLADGSLGQVDLVGQVELSDQGLHLSGGSQAALNLEDGTFAIHGPAVELYNERAEVVAPRITWSRETGLIRASEGVRAVLAERSVEALAATPFGRGRGPIRVDAAEALWTAAPPTFSFRGEVRAWQGQSLLLADQLRGDEKSGELAASGRVKTIFLPSPGAPAGPRALGAAGEPIEVTAQRMTYSQSERQLVYDGEVMIRQEQRTIACKELSVELAAAGGAKRMTCDDRVRLTDPEGGRRVEGDRAVYTLAEERIVVSGQQVVLRDGDDNRLVGRYLLYDLAAGTVRFHSQPGGGTDADAR